MIRRLWATAAIAARTGPLARGVAVRALGGVAATGDDGDAPKKKRAPRARKAAAPPEVPVPAAPRPARAQAPHEAAAPTDDAPILFGEPPTGELFHATREWVVFSDLHVSARSLPACLATLEAVHAEAVARSAGAVFLGDWWEKRGALPVEPLNAVMAALSTWHGVPVLMLPGNHDQVTAGGELHALSPLQHAPPAGCHVFSRPTLFRGALWLPYRRDRTALVAAIRASAPGGLSAVFAHADVMGASMNAAVQACDGLDPGVFPAGVPVYSGHYHLPHTVPGTAITYVGSPYQITRSEAGQSKRLVVLDAATGWRPIAHRPLDVGPRHVTLDAAGRPPRGVTLRPGDRVDLTVDLTVVNAATRDVPPAPAAADKSHSAAAARLARAAAAAAAMTAAAAVESMAAALRSAGCEVRLAFPAPGVASRPPRIARSAEMSPAQLLEAYAAAPRGAGGVGGGALTGGALALARRALSAVGGDTGGVQCGRPPAHLVFHAVTLEGYGPFVGPVTYALKRGGARIVTGDNRDAGGGDAPLSVTPSNGAGKTALVFAPLWCLTGSSDARSPGDTGGALTYGEVVHEDCKTARVAVTGEINGTPFVVERCVTRTALARFTFTLGGVDRTCLESKMTAAALESLLPTSLLRATAFHGQHDVTGLLTASDGDFKDALARAAGVDIWTAVAAEAAKAAKAARAESGAAAAVARDRDAAAAVAQGDADDAAAAAAEHASDRAAVMAEREAEMATARVGLADSRAALVAAARGAASAAEAWTAADAAVCHALDGAPAGGAVGWGAEVEGGDDGDADGDNDRDRDRGGDDDDALADSAATSPRLLAWCTDAELKSLTQATAAVAAARARLAAARGVAATARSALADVGDTTVRHGVGGSHPGTAVTITCRHCGQAVSQAALAAHASTIAAESTAAAKAAAAARRELASRVREAIDAANTLASGPVRGRATRVVSARQVVTRGREAAATIRGGLSRVDALLSPVVGEDPGDGCGDGGVGGDAATDWAGPRLSTAEDVSPVVLAAVCRVADSTTDAAAALESAVATRGQWTDYAGQVQSSIAALDGEAPREAIRAQLTAEAAAAARLAATTARATYAAAEATAAEHAAAESALGRSGVQSYALEASLGEVEARAAVYLESLSGGSLRLELSAARPKKDGGEVERITKTAVAVGVDGVPRRRSLRQLSGGEQRRVALALALAFSDFAADRGGLRCELLVLDEVLQHLDGDGALRAASTLRALAATRGTVLLVSQASAAINDCFDAVDVVSKAGNAATVVQARPVELPSAPAVVVGAPM